MWSWGRSALLIFLLFLALFKYASSFNIQVITDGVVTYHWNDDESVFDEKSTGWDSERLTGTLVYPVPRSACRKVLDPIKHNESVLVFAYFDEFFNNTECSIDEKLLYIFNAGFDGVIAGTMHYDQQGFNVKTRSVLDRQALVPLTVGQKLIQLAIQNNGTATSFVKVWDDSYLIYKRLFIIFGSLLLGAVIVSTLIFCCSIFCRTLVMKWKTRGLSHWRVRSLPKRKYRKSVESCESCSICLEDFIDGENVRVLPCDHVFHPSCVDEWLRKWNRVCPLCKCSISRHGHSAPPPSSAGEEGRALLAEGQPTTDHYGSTADPGPTNSEEENQSLDVMTVEVRSHGTGPTRDLISTVDGDGSSNTNPAPEATA